MKQIFTVKNSSKGSRNFEQYNTAVKRNETRVALVMMVKVIQIFQRYILFSNLSCIDWSKSSKSVKSLYPPSQDQMMGARDKKTDLGKEFLTLMSVCHTVVPEKVTESGIELPFQAFIMSL